MNDDEIELRHAEYLARLTTWQRFRRWCWLYQEANWLIVVLIVITVALALW